MLDNIFIVFGFALQSYGLYSGIRWVAGALTPAPTPRRNVIKSIRKMDEKPLRNVIKSIRKMDEKPLRNVIKSIRPV